MCHTSPPTHCLHMALHDCYKLIYLWSWCRPWRKERPIHSACFFFLLHSFFVIVVVIYLWKEGSPLCCPVSATTTRGPYHVLLQSMWVMLEKAKEKKGKINGQTCLQYAYVWACVYKYTYICMYKKGKRWVSTRTGHSVLTCTMYVHIQGP